LKRHTQSINVTELDRLREKVGGSIAFTRQSRAGGGAALSSRRDVFAGKLQNRDPRDTRAIPPGGTTFHIHGLDTPLAIVANALFAGLQAASVRIIERLKLIRESHSFRAG